MTRERSLEAAWKALDRFRIELPSWGFANTGTRFGKFVQPSAANTLEEKFSDAAEVHALTGACPTLALHVLWDLPRGLKDVGEVERLAKKYGVRPGSINPNVFQDQEYKYGSLGNPDATIRRKAVTHILDCVAIADALGCRDISPWFADGSNYPGTQSIRKRIGFFEEGLRTVYAALHPGQRLLIEYKPFEPAFYHTDIGDWGMALLLAQGLGTQAFVLVDTGHHYAAQNIEQIVAWLLHHGRMGGFHFNDRRYADDDLTLGSIDPYQIFRIFNEILAYEWETGGGADIAYMVDQSHNLKGKIEAMIQTVCTAQELYAKAALVDHARLGDLQSNCALVEAEETLRGCFWQDTRALVAEWRKRRALPEDPLQAFRESGYLERATRERAERNRGTTASYA
ncbi:MAG TPA: TIM barrel protein [Candidatus Acidoferrales bacterium]|nr:TIM barrel protein [Candidatus Acidoferrales bacterium]